MSEAIAGFTFTGIWLASALWVVLDAEARGRNPFVWGVATFFLGPFALGAYAMTGDRGARGSAHSQRRTYFFTASFFFLGVTYAGLVAMVGVFLDAGASQDPIDSEDARVATAILLSLLVFSIPLWAFHWVKALSLLEETHGESEDRATYLQARRYGAVVLVAGGLVSLGFAVFLMFTFFSAVMDVYEGGRDQFLPVVAFLPLTILLVAYHWVVVFGSSPYRRLAERLEGPAPSPQASEQT